VKPFNAVICGAGIAGTEGLLRLRKLAGDRVDITVLSAKEEFTYRPIAILEPFAKGRANRYSVARIAADNGARWLPDDLSSVDPHNHTVHTRKGEVLDYDALLLAIGGRERKPPEHMQVFTDRNADEMYRAILSGIEAGEVKSVAFVMPAGPSWPLPLYELALLTAKQMHDIAAPDIIFVTPERLPLQAFGEHAAETVAGILRDAGITLYCDADVRVMGPGELLLYTSGTRVHADRIVTIPRITGPNVAGIAGDAGDRFLPIDGRCRVLGTDGRVFAAGDATDLPVKHGGIGAQQADVAAAGIAHLAGLIEAPAPMHPVIRGMLLTGHNPLFLMAHVVAGRGWQAEIYDTPPWPTDEKVIAEELGPYLRTVEAG